MAPNDDHDLLPENTAGYKLSQPKQTLEEYQKMGKSSDGKLVYLPLFLSFLDNGPWGSQRLR